MDSNPNLYPLVELVVDYDVTRGNRKFLYEMPAHSSYSVQVVHKTLGAVLDGIIKVQQANEVDGDNSSWDDHPTFTYTPAAATSSHSFISTVPAGTKYICVDIDVNTWNAGTVTLLLQINK